MPFENSSLKAPQTLEVSPARGACPLCGTRASRCFFEQKGVPIHQNVLMASPEEARACPRGDLALAACEHCGLIFNTAFEESEQRFPANYNNTQTYSPRYLGFLEAMAEDLVERYALENRVIVDIGCGRGMFLRLLCRGQRNRGVGFDPSYAGPETAEGGAVRFVREFFDERQTAIPADIVVSRHVLDVIPEPRRLLAAMRKGLASSPRAKFVIELPDANWVLGNVALWDVGYERCNYFSRQSLRWMMEREGFHVTRIYSCLGGEYIWLEAHPGAGKEIENAPPALAALEKTIAGFSQYAQRKIADSLRILQENSRLGACCVWGAAGKGTAFLNLVDPHCQTVRYAVDLNPAKQGKFVPGTGHPIVGPEHLAKAPVASVILLNPNYQEEVSQHLRAMGIGAPLRCL
jgi:SAM-dependent methyltransferase